MSKAKIDTKQSIVQAIQSLAHPSDLSQTALSFFEALGYSSERQLPLSNPTYECFEDSYVKNNFHTNNFKPEKALSTQWKYVDFLFQITAEELKEQLAGFSTQKIDNTIIESYLFFVLELEQNEYSRSQLSQITREINKLFSMPVMILFKHDTSLTLAIINRRLHKKDESKDVLEKVTLIKDISTQSPHRAHIEILFDLSLPEIIRKYKVSNFVELHQAWQKTLDTKELNKNFYKELSNWYFWAIKHISFPGDIEKNEEIRNATSLIRLLTRIIFIWFIKEKGLVDEKLFTPSYLKQILHNFDSNSTDSSFYQAILQNLFFATLNQKISERKFAQNGCQSINKKEYGVKTLYRYDDQYTISKEQVLELFKPTPFLNGGLFDCLDKEDESLKVQYADGFSRNPSKRAEVPDFLFFGSEVEVDLNSVYDTKKNKYTSRGLINILDSFKFTITENSPIEEEIALDPELLGKVFENLLASYNPETQTTARKSTGSFYTPREIVHYMVDESLLAYFKQKLEDKGINDSEEKLRSLIGYNEDPNPFNPNESQILIQAVDTCKILDPACGSGAFPMGILQKLVHILHKLDPNNQLWKEKQLQKTRQIDISELRDQNIKDIESAFTNNELDYPRKLYLIENCIYGVDIQPIAIQIAKLRFFISLIIDQKKQSTEENYGILALPNLETKFVCANTLIGLDKPEGFIRDPEIEAKEQELKMVRHDYFSSKTREQKIAYQKKDKALREQISRLLIHDGWNDVSAHQVAGWDPYDQNASSPFFDPEWMFGLREGFDIVIGNPPYDVYQGYRNDEIEIIKKQSIFQFAKGGKLNAYKLFIAKAYKLQKDKGMLCQIFQNSFLGDSSAKNLRELFIKQQQILKIDSFPERDDANKRVFYGVKMSTCILLSRNTNPKKYTFCLNIYEDKCFNNKRSITFSNDEIQRLDSESFTILSMDETEKSVFIKISTNTKMKNFGKCYEGEINLTFHKEFLSVVQSNRSPMIKGAAVQKYFVKSKMSQGDIEYIDKQNYLSKVNGKKSSHHQLKRIIMQGITGVDDKNRLIMTLLDKGTFCGNSVNYILLNEENQNHEYFLGLLNSKIVNWYFKKFSTNSNVNGYEVDNLAIKYNTNFLYPVGTIVNYILILKDESNIYQKNIDSFFEQLIDAIVYELYFQEELTTANCEFLRHLTNMPEIKEEWSIEKKSKIIQGVYEELSDPTHPVSIAMGKMKSIPEIRIIEGLNK